MISFRELLSGEMLNDVPIAHQHNLEELLKAVNLLRAEWGKPMIVTSGYRTMQKHLQIYSRKGITDRTLIPMKSKHLVGLAVDFADPTGDLYQWAKDNEHILEKCGIWCESGTVGWLHCQCVPYGSYEQGKSRLFKP
jgi:uncharacterized protein YcbK (DUF882 family)